MNSYKTFQLRARDALMAFIVDNFYQFVAYLIGYCNVVLKENRKEKRISNHLDRFYTKKLSCLWRYSF